MILYETKYLTLKSAQRLNKPDWVYVTRQNAKNVVVILPVIKKHDTETILFLITKRPPLEFENKAEFCVEIPAGLVGDEDSKETIDEALKKELLEETGLEASNFEICSYKVSSSGGLSDETSVIAIAHIFDDIIKKEPVDDGGVIIERVYVEKSEIKNFLSKMEQKGYAISAQTLAALYYLK